MFSPRSARRPSYDSRQIWGRGYPVPICGRRDHPGHKSVPPHVVTKADGGRRPIGILTLEEKISQGAAAEVLSAAYEVHFLEISYSCLGRGTTWS